MAITETVRRSRRLRQMRAYYRRKAIALELLGCQCRECSETDPTQLQFDHITRTGKQFDLFGNRWSTRFRVWLAELQKTQPLCSACHIDKTSFEKPRPYQEPAPF